jgi:arylsulfatase A-like enzyme
VQVSRADDWLSYGRSRGKATLFAVSEAIASQTAVTLESALKSVGYETALVRKWHLGSKPEWGPQQFGFDHSYGSLADGVTSYTTSP